MTRAIFQNAHEAIRAGQACAPCGIAYDKGFRERPAGWYVYDLKQGIEDITGATPEFVCIRSGRLPIALSDEGAAILSQLVWIGGNQ